MNKIIEVIKKAIGSENENSEGDNFIPFETGEKVAFQVENENSKFKNCVLEIKEILNNSKLDNADVIDKFKELEELHNSKVKNLKGVLKEQTQFYKDQRTEIKGKLKERGQKITDLETQLKTANEAINIYSKLDAKYFEAKQQIEKLNKINDAQRNLILKKHV